jgi:hypothetical protein
MSERDHHSIPRSCLVDLGRPQLEQSQVQKLLNHT